MKKDYTIAKILLGNLIVIILVVVGVNLWMQSQAEKSCKVFGEVSNRETKYVEYTWWNFSCITPDSNGKWIDISFIRDVSVE